MSFPSTPDRFFESPLGKTHYRYIEVESAQVICILPGFSIPSAGYYQFAHDLSENGFSVIVIDYFGRGYSEPSQEFDFTFNSYAKQVLDLMNHLKIEKFGLISFSIGAHVAANIAEASAASITKLVFISPFHFVLNEMHPFQRYLLSNSLFGPLVLKLVAPRFIPPDIAGQFTDLTKHEEIYWAVVGCCLHQLNMNPTYCTSLSKFISKFSESDIPENLQKITQMSVRTLVLLGQKDQIIDTEESCKWWEYWMPNVKVESIENVGHLMFLEEPDSIIEMISTFLHR